MKSDLQALREYEVTQAAKRRGECRNCGHLWRPRNPNPTVNRCPGCGMRGLVRYEVISDEPNKDAGAEGLVSELQAGGRAVSRKVPSKRPKKKG